MNNLRPIYAGIGSRETPPRILSLMTRIAKRLELRGWLLHSGGADGADQAFELGVSNRESNAKIFLPWPGFRLKERRDLGLYGGEFIEPTEAVNSIARKFHPAYDKLKRGGRACMARNGYQVLGELADRPIDCVVCWTRDGGATGGTGQALRIAASYNVPIFNLYYDEALNKLGDFVRQKELNIINDLRSEFLKEEIE